MTIAFWKFNMYHERMLLYTLRLLLDSRGTGLVSAGE